MFIYKKKFPKRRSLPKPTRPLLLLTVFLGRPSPPPPTVLVTRIFSMSNTHHSPPTPTLVSTRTREKERERENIIECVTVSNETIVQRTAASKRIPGRPFFRLSIHVFLLGYFTVAFISYRSTDFGAYCGSNVETVD